MTRVMDSYEKAARHLLNSPLLHSKLEAEGYEFPRDIAVIKLRSRSWSSGERLMVALALHLFNSTHPCPPISDLIEVLDERNFERCMEAVWIRRHGR